MKQVNFLNEVVTSHSEHNIKTDFRSSVKLCRFTELNMQGSYCIPYTTSLTNDHSSKNICIH